MPPIFVLSLAKRIATQILVTAKWIKGKIVLWELLFVTSPVPTRNYLSKVYNWSTRIRCENCSRLRMKAPERCQRRLSSVSIVNSKYISNFFLIIDFEQANVFWIKTFEDKIWYIKRYVVVIYVWPKCINK